MKKDKIEFIYILSVVLAFSLLFFANAENQEAPDGTVVNLGIGKSFYIPCGVALLCSFIMKIHHDKYEKILHWMIGLTAISFLLHPSDSSNPLDWGIVRFSMAVLCFKDLRHITPSRFIYWVSLFGPFIVIPHYLLSNPFGYGAYRYAGFYGDPNFLALALNFLITMSYLSYKIHDKKHIRVFAAITIIGAIPLILVGMSRGGILGLVIVLFFIGRDILRYSKTIFIAIVVGFFAFSAPTLLKFGDTFELIESRFKNESASDAGGARARIEGIESVFNVFSNRPDFIPFGIGPGNTSKTIAEYKKYGYICPYIVHSTYFAILYELGIFVTWLYLWLHIFVYKNLKRKKNYLLLGLFLSAVLSLLTLPGVAFMPAWILLFFLSNNNISQGSIGPFNSNKIS